VATGYFGLPGEDQFRNFAGNVGNNRLVIGQSFRETEDLERIALVSFGWASVVIVALGVAGGAWLAGRAQRRLDGIERTMVEVSGGNLAHRIPLQGNGDDIDVVAEHMNRALDRLSGLVEGMRQVSTDIAHDLKTPLNRLKMTVEQAIQQSERGHAAIDLLLEARAEADHINATFEALLRVSQIEAGARKTRFKRVDLSAIIASVAEIYSDVAIDNGQSISLQPTSADLHWVHGDRELLTQMFVNIVENAINHCPAGSAILIGLVVSQYRLSVLIADDGPGIAPEQRELVFRRLYRLDKSRTTPGSGLGLSLVKAIAELHGAMVLLEDNKPGLRVVVQFPIHEPN
jgi:signal transduction histidine kinase